MTTGHSSRERLHRRPADPRNPHVHHNRRAWTDNGMHFTLETASFGTPLASFGGVRGYGAEPFDAVPSFQRSHTQPSMTAGGALLGAVFHILNDLASAPSGGAGRRNVQVEEGDSDDEMDEDYDSDLAYEAAQRPRPKNLFSRVKGKLINNLEGRQGRTRREAYSREQSPIHRPSANNRQRSYRTEERTPRGAAPRSAPAMEEEDEVDYEERPQASRSDSYTDSVSALEHIVMHYQNEVKKCKKQFERALRAPNVDSRYLQGVLDQLKSSESSLASATHNLQLAEANAGRGSRRTRQAHCHNRPTPRTRAMDDDLTDPFAQLFGASRRGDPFGMLQGEHDDFDSFNDPIFGAFHPHFTASSPLHDDLPAFFAVPGAAPGGTSTHGRRKRPAYVHASSGRSRAQPPTEHVTFSPPPQLPPPTLLKPDEAKKLYKTYNDRWTALPHTDPNIAYPTRTLHADTLTLRDTLWSPKTAHPSTWSEETIMQANAQAFFLGVVGLSPEYSERPGTGAIETGFKRSQASTDQVSQLIDVLKKERMRWHSDRLGRRSGGGAGVNEALQQDPRARAVLHGVLELMEVACQ